MKTQLFIFGFSLIALNSFATERNCGYVNRLYFSEDGTLIARVRQGDKADKIPQVDPKDWQFNIGLSKNEVKNQQDQQLAFAALNSKSALCRCAVENQRNKITGTEYSYFIAEDIEAYASLAGPCDAPIIIRELKPE